MEFFQRHWRHAARRMMLTIIIAGSISVTCLHAQTPPEFNLSADQPGTIVFTGSATADLFSKETAESFKGVLERNYFSHPDGKFPAGFVQASPAPQAWSGTMWTRDGGTFLRELAMWGYYEHAKQTARCLMDFSATNAGGFIAFPRYFAPKHGREAGTEVDGNDTIIIGMVALWQRLPPDDPFRAQLYDFLHRNPSPVRFLHHELEQHPLIAGTGEFGAGGPKGLVDNVVQNNLSALALLTTANMEEAAGDDATAQLWRKDAKTIFQNMEKYLVDQNGAWIWCIDPQTLKPDPAVLQKPVNIGFGGLNGVYCMSADVLGFDPTAWPEPGLITHGEKTFDQLLAFPLRKELFDKYGIWTQFNVISHGLLTSPSYGQGYALQTMLLSGKLDMAGHGLDFLTHATYDAPDLTFPNGRLSPYYFYERLYAPGAKGKTELATGCGPLNLVNVTEPLKIARLIAGIDDTSLADLRIMPRLPPGWSAVHAENWPVRTKNGISRIDVSWDAKDRTVVLHLLVKAGPAIPELSAGPVISGQPAWAHRSDVREIRMSFF